MMENNSEEIFFNRDHFPVLREVFLIARREMFQVAGCGCVDEWFSSMDASSIGRRHRRWVAVFRDPWSVWV